MDKERIESHLDEEELEELEEDSRGEDLGAGGRNLATSIQLTFFIFFWDQKEINLAVFHNDASQVMC